MYLSMRTAQSRFVTSDSLAVSQVLPVLVCSSRAGNLQKRTLVTVIRQYLSHLMKQMRIINLSWRTLRWQRSTTKMSQSKRLKRALSWCQSWSSEQILNKNRLKMRRKSAKKCRRDCIARKKCAKTWSESSQDMLLQGGIAHLNLYCLRRIMGQPLTCGLSDAYSLSCLEWWKRAHLPTWIESHCSPANPVSRFLQIEMPERKERDSLFQRMINLLSFSKSSAPQPTTTNLMWQMPRP